MKKSSVLLVDDEADLRLTIKDSIAQRYGKDLLVIEASNGREAIHKIQNQAFQCILTDLSMPKLSGQELIDTLKNSDLNRHTPVIILTGHPDPGLLERHEYLTLVEKPFEMEQLIGLMKKQIDLGPTHHRVPTHLLKSLIEVVPGLLESQFGLKVAPAKPEARAPGQPLKGKRLYCFKTNFDHDLGSFVLGFNQEMIEALSKNREGSDNLLEKMDQLVQACIARVRKKASSSGVQEAKVSQYSQFEFPQDEKNFRLVHEKKGICFPLSAGEATLYCQAISGSPDFPKK